MMNTCKVIEKLSFYNPRGAWKKGVRAYALDLMDNIESEYFTEKDLLNGAHNWVEYSEGGAALCYDKDIALRLCAPWELRKTDSGRKEPNKFETWIDVQTRALYQAASLIKNMAEGGV